MANIVGTYYSNQSYNPKFTYYIDYWQTARTASSITYKFSVSYSKQNGWYGYDIIINWNVGGATGSKQLKSTADSASGSTEFYVTCSTNTAGGTLSASIWTSSSTDSTHWQNQMSTGSRTVNKSSFNTAPTLSGTVTVNGNSGNFYIPENTQTVNLSWPKASDSEGNLSGYRIRLTINGSSTIEVARVGASVTTYTANVSSYGEGTTLKYTVDAYDSLSEWSGNAYSPVVTKNTLSAASISASSSLGFLSSNGTISFLVSGGSNTNGAAVTRTLTCSGITVYNGTLGTGSLTIGVYVSGTTPTGPYIKFADVKNALKNSSYQGNLTFTLTTTNSYGGKKAASTTVWCNLLTAPNATSSVSVSEVSTESTAYIQPISSRTEKYFIPDGSKKIRVKWNASSGKLGEAITYAVLVKYGSGSWQMVKEGLSSSTLYYDHTVPKQSAKTTIKYCIRTSNSFGLSADKEMGSTKDLHYYNGLSFTKGAITRTSTNCTAAITCATLTSIPNITMTGKWGIATKGTAASYPYTITMGAAGTISNAATLNANTAGFTLEDSKQYTIFIQFTNDTSLNSAAYTTTIEIGANSPIFFINKYGIGVNGAKATSSYPLNVRGSINASGNIVGVDLFATGNGKQLRMYVPNASYAWLDTNATSGLYINSNLSVKGEIYAGSSYNNRVYHTGYKPTPADIGALASGGKAADATKVSTSNGGGFFEGNGDGASSTTSNVKIKSWYGIGFAPSISGQSVPQNENAIWMNVRNGEINSRGNMNTQGSLVANSSVIAHGSMRCSNTLYFTGDSSSYWVKAAWEFDRANINVPHLSVNGYANVKAGVLTLGQSSNASYVEFYDNTGKRKGYVGKGNTGVDSLYLCADVDKYILTIGHLCPSGNRMYWLGTNSPAQQWKGVCCEGGTVGASDARAKENIERLDGSLVSYDIDTDALVEYNLSEFKRSDRANSNDYYEFIKDRFKPSYYNYKLTEEINPETDDYVINPIDEYDMLKNVGFIAQDYDITTDKVAREFIYRNSDGEYSYNHMSYATTGLIALQVACKKIDSLEQEVVELKEIVKQLTVNQAT